MVEPRHSLTPVETQYALDTIELFGLDRHPEHPKFSIKDFRWQFRNTAWQKAQRALERWQRCPSIDMEEAILDQATDSGFFSVWMEVFQNVPTIRQKLIAAFPNTAQDCFDPQTLPIKRPNGKL
jgi:hypothetical protein